jgi:RND family efflux transporter MFP subunit
VEPVRLGSISAAVSATGVVDTLQGAVFTLAAPQPARIAEITKNVGEPVTSGELLVRFEFPSLKAQTIVNAAAIKAADTRVQQARLHQSRVRNLVSRGAASQREMDDADRDLAAAEADLLVAKSAQEAAEAEALHTTVRAPFNGIVKERLRNPGDMVRPEDSDPILRVIDPKQVQVTATVPIADAGRFTVGAAARAIAADKGSGELLHVAARPQPEAGAKTIAVTLEFDTPTELTPGTQVAIEIDAEQRSNVPLVPAIAVLKDDPNNPVVVVASGNVAMRRPVRIGLVDAQHAEIQSGLKPGELIITQGQSSLRDGAPITISTP